MTARLPTAALLRAPAGVPTLADLMRSLQSLLTANRRRSKTT